MRFVECVPNFSEGRNQDVLDKIATSISSVEGVTLGHVDVGYDANRTVMTFWGEMEAVFEAMYNAFKVAVEQIDMSQHKGEHPRMGAVDVCPFIPIKGISEDELVPFVDQFSRRVSADFSLPVIAYEASATAPHRKNLAAIRKGEYEGWGDKIKEDRWVPDFSTKDFNPQTGVSAVGVRFFLIAYNITLDTKDIKIAQKVARAVREKGDDNRPYRLKALKAIGWWMEEYNYAQVSMNLVDFRKTSIAQVFDAVKLVSNSYGVSIVASELIGMLPEVVLADAAKYWSTSGEVMSNDAVVQRLKLNALHDFSLEDRVLRF